jgi:hypothetical protein
MDFKAAPRIRREPFNGYLGQAPLHGLDWIFESGLTRSSHVTLRETYIEADLLCRKRKGTAERSRRAITTGASG